MENFENGLINFLPIKFDLHLSNTSNVFQSIVREVREFCCAPTRTWSIFFCIGESWQMISWLFYLFCVTFAFDQTFSKLSKSGEMITLLFDTNWKSNDFSLSNFRVSFYRQRLDRNFFSFQWIWSTISIESWILSYNSHANSHPYSQWVCWKSNNWEFFVVLRSCHTIYLKSFGLVPIAFFCRQLIICDTQ